MQTKKESAADVERWLRDQVASLWPAALGSMSFRQSRCMRESCEACRSGRQHRSHVLYLRIEGRRSAIYVPEELAPMVQRCLDNGHTLQKLLYQSAVRYLKALKNDRARSQKQKVKK